MQWPAVNRAAVERWRRKLPSGAAMRYHGADMHDAERAALLAVIEAQNATIQALHGWIRELTRNGQATKGGPRLPSPPLAAPSATALLAPPAGDGNAPPAAAPGPASGARVPGRGGRRALRP